MIIDVEKNKVYGDPTTEENRLILNLLAFINNDNIDVIQNIFKGKVKDDVMQNLLDKMKSICNKNKDIRISWIDFIENLDKDNRIILEKYIFQ